MSRHPLVSVGLPVYNGQNYLSEAIESMINQTYTNFELIISDNGSTDKTRQICEKFASMDERIRYHRFDKNYGACKNYNKTFELAKGKYFKWLAHDDLVSSNALAQWVEVLEENDDVVLCVSSKMNINARGEIIDTHHYRGLNLLQNDPVKRHKAFLKYFAFTFADADMIMGLMRKDVLAHTRLIGNYTSSDFTLLADLILKGKFKVLEEPLWQRRIHHGFSMSVFNDYPDKASQIDPASNIVYRSHAEIAKWFDPNGKVRRVPHVKWLSDLIESIDRSKLNMSDKIKLHVTSYNWFMIRALKSVKDRLSKTIVNPY